MDATAAIPRVWLELLAVIALIEWQMIIALGAIPLVIVCLVLEL